jgi:hypothetical protein
MEYMPEGAFVSNSQHAARPSIGRTADLIKPIVRTCGERTTGLAVRLLAEIFPVDDIEVIQEVPFEKALRATYEVAIASGREWAFVMDADVLPSPSRLLEAFALCADRTKDVFVFRGLVLDKFFGWPREVGNYIYRTEYLGTALDLVPDSGSAVRPEFATISAMHARGYAMQTIEAHTYAVHDFEQYYRDLFRKGFVYAEKHPAMQILTDDWEKKADIDPDFLVILAGTVAHRVHGGGVEIDVRQFPQDLSDYLAGFGLTEKDPLLVVGELPVQVDALISSWSPSPVFHAYRAFLGVWPQRLLDLSPTRMRALIGWMRQSRARGSLGAELRSLLRASFGWATTPMNLNIEIPSISSHSNDRKSDPEH